ncbi:MAG: cytochrome c oxidase subunit II transmembrane domain-containing protein [Steroidobacteraceae bacterium]
MTMLAICTLIAVAVFAVMIHSIATFRRTPESASTSRERPLAEVFWAIVPILIIVSTALPAVRMLTAEDDAQQTARQSKSLLATPAVYHADSK